MGSKFKLLFLGFGIFFLGAIANSHSTSPKGEVQGVQATGSVIEATVTPVATQSYPSPTIYQAPKQTSSDLSNDRYYTNSDGNEVHSPAYSDNGSVPAGASAQCSDGTYSFSQHRSGTCSHHGGVAVWY